MRQLAVIIWFLSNVAGGLTVRAQEIPVSTDTAAPAAAPELQAILADWVSRESRLRSGQFEWRVLRRIRSAKFGALSAADASVAQEETDPDFGEVGLQLERLLRTRFDASSFRLHGTSISAVPSAKPHSPSSIPASASVEGQFRAALAARFSLPISLEKPQPYMVQIDPQREVHFWAQDGAAPPLGLVLGAGQRSRYLDDHSSAALLTMLLDAMRFAVRPSIDAGGFAQKGGQDCRVLPQTAVVDGRRCLVIEEPHRNVRYWIDPSCGSVVVRHVLFGTDGAVRWQSDIDYDRNAACLMPPSRTSDRSAICDAVHVRNMP